MGHREVRRGQVAVIAPGGLRAVELALTRIDSGDFGGHDPPEALR
jgi:hypothetical protein